jgi:HlyD family secretion protein
MKKYIIVFGVLVVVGVLGFVAMGSSKSKESPYKTVAVEKATIVDKALAVGEIVPRQEVQVKSRISGIVKTLHAEVGDRVSQGDPLLVISPNPTPLEYAEARRSVDLAAVDLDNARKVLVRYEGLYQKKLISEAEFEVHKTEQAQAELRHRLAVEKLELLERGTTADGTSENTILSPINGTILERLVSEGDPVVPLTTYQAGTALLTMAPMSELIFKGTVDEIDVGKLASGMPVEIKVGALPDAKVEGTLTRISPKARKQDNATLFDLEIELAGATGTTLRAGYSANADIVIKRKDSVLVVPERLVTFAGDSATVEILDSTTQQVSVRKIQTGLSDGLQIEVSEGLALGELVVERPPKEIE